MDLAPAAELSLGNDVADWNLPQPVAASFPSRLDHSGVEDVSLQEALRVELVNAPIWRQFNEQTTEMIVTPSGRCLFPIPKLRLVGPRHADCLYAVELEAHPLNDLRYRWDSHAKIWKDTGPLLHCYPASRVTHSKGFVNVHDFDVDFVFDKTKLTNGGPAEGKLSVNASRFYRLIAYVKWKKCNSEQVYESRPFIFPETEFVAVTVYQNPAMRALKKANNPHASWLHARAGHDRKSPTARVDHAEAKKMKCTVRKPAATAVTALAVKPALTRKDSSESSSSSDTSKLDSLSIPEQDNFGRRPSSSSLIESVMSILFPEDFLESHILDPMPNDSLTADDLFLPWEATPTVTT